MDPQMTTTPTGFQDSWKPLLSQLHCQPDQLPEPIRTISIKGGKRTPTLFIQQVGTQRPPTQQMCLKQGQGERFHHTPVRAVALLYRILRPTVDKQRGVCCNQIKSKTLHPSTQAYSSCSLPWNCL